MLGPDPAILGPDLTMPFWALTGPCWALTVPFWALTVPFWALTGPFWALTVPFWVIWKHGRFQTLRKIFKSSRNMAGFNKSGILIRLGQVEPDRARQSPAEPNRA